MAIIFYFKLCENMQVIWLVLSLTWSNFFHHSDTHFVTGNWILHLFLSWLCSCHCKYWADPAWWERNKTGGTSQENISLNFRERKYVQCNIYSICCIVVLLILCVNSFDDIFIFVIMETMADFYRNLTYVWAVWAV